MLLRDYPARVDALSVDGPLRSGAGLASVLLAPPDEKVERPTDPARPRVADILGAARGTASNLRDLVLRALVAASAVTPWAARAAGGRLLRQHRFDEAETLLEAAARAFPRHVGVLARRALVAEKAGRFAEAQARWREVLAVSPARGGAWRGLAVCARQLGDNEGARSAIARALALGPNDRRILLDAGRIYDAVDDYEPALAVWARLASRRRNDPIYRQGYAEALIRLGRLEEAEREIEIGLVRHPDHRHMLAARGMLMMRREQWDAALALWSAYVADYPDDETGRTSLMRVTSVRQLITAKPFVEPPQMLAPTAVERIDDPAVRALLLRFEGIGSDCEFGTLQRRYGAEPLGLLRWNDVTFPTLMAALETRFAGMGDPETTELVAGEIGELYMRDTRWDLGMHTFLFAGEVCRETVFPKMCRRVSYLRDKFLADLEAGEKVLVYKSADLSFAELAGLHDRLRSFGPVRLLHVRPAHSAGVAAWPEGRAGSVTAVAPDLYVGYIERMGDLYDVALDDWVAVCRATASAVDELAPGVRAGKIDQLPGGAAHAA